MTTAIPNVQTIPQGATRTNALTADDITRLPKSYAIAQNGQESDTYESQSGKNGAKRLILGAALLAAVIVCLKHCSFMKIDGEAKTFAQKFIKKPINKLGEWIELPFVKIKNFFTKKADAGEEVVDEIIPPASETTEKLRTKVWNYTKNVFRHPWETIRHPKLTWRSFFSKEA